jgi:hypothetical protein
MISIEPNNNTNTHKILIKFAFMYKILSKINKVILPSFSKQGLDLAKAKKWQLVIIGYRYYITKKALGN